jgi:DHA1 family bicyclomycin/chloramphenicol resistance-like MFS transporter
MTALLALSMALAALGIDLMLPAFPAIRRSFDLAADSTAVAGLVTAYFFGLAIGQLVYGPLSDRYGRRPTLYGGYLIYAIGALAGAAAPSLTLLLVARVVWGFGASGPRVVTQAVIRDTYEGDAMARAMSLVMAVFLVVPVVAPTLGATIVHFGSWRWIFIGCVGFATLMSIWAVRLPETLRPEHRMELRFGRVASAAKLVVTDRQALTYTLAQTSLYGGFTAYIGSSQTIIDETFHRKAQFPLIFGGLGAMMGVAMLVNARVVSRFTARRVVHAVLFLFLANALAFVLIALATDGKPPIGVFIVLMAVVVSCHALLIPNSASIAMLPMAAVAGTAASIMGATQIAGGAILGSITDNAFDGTVRPLAFGFLGYGALAFGLVLWGERGRLFGTAAGADEPTASAVEVVV